MSCTQIFKFTCSNDRNKYKDIKQKMIFLSLLDVSRTFKIILVLFSCNLRIALTTHTCKLATWFKS